MSGLDMPTYSPHYRREPSRRRAEAAAEQLVEAEAAQVSDLGPLSPPNPAFAKGRRKDSTYYSGGPSGQGGPAELSAGPNQTVSSLDSDSHGTWSQISGSKAKYGIARSSSSEKLIAGTTAATLFTSGESAANMSPMMPPRLPPP